jgi:hypothetical protein
MDSQSHHAINNRKWRLDMIQPRLSRPWSKPFDGMLLFHRDDAILMPAQGPIILGTFVKQ